MRFVSGSKWFLLAALLLSAADRPRRAVAAIDGWVLQTASGGPTEFLVFLEQQADLSAATALPTKEQKGQYVYERLVAVAEATQAPLLAYLAANEIPHRAYWVANMIRVSGDLSVVQTLARRPEVAHIYANPHARLPEPTPGLATYSPLAVEWNIIKIRAPEVWAAGFEGQGVVVGGQDTGYDWNHPALKAQYRGWDGATADHNYAWHDAIHGDNPQTPAGNPCGFSTTAPCDDHGHGSHTLGTMVGDDGGANQIGVAPQAHWIGCRNMEQGVGSPATYAECYQWFIAPTDLSNANPDPAKAPHIINNSWGCPPSEGCTDPEVLRMVVENVRAAGILTVHSAGNSGPDCSSVGDPAAIYDASYTVGATDDNDLIAGFSSRGPVLADGSNRLKPDITAPGVGIRSSVPGGGYATMSGTSMAAPHVAGLAALLISANPALAGKADAIEALINGTAVPRSADESCGGLSGSAVPNNTFGYGRVDALNAYINIEPEFTYLPMLRQE